MKERVQFVGVDVDDKAYHLSVFCSESEDCFDINCGPSPDLLIKTLKKHKNDPSISKICYEASYIEFSIQRRLAKAGYDCQIAAPSLIPIQPGSKQKTDKLDSRKLAKFHAKGLLTFIYIPDESDESRNTRKT